MKTTQTAPVAGGTDQQSARLSLLGQAIRFWPALLILAAWSVALCAVFTDHTAVIDHHFLLETSHFPLWKAGGLFLASWQVMTLAMMLPSSMPFLALMSVASRRQQQAHLPLAVFLAAYLVVWTAFALAAFLGDALVHWLVDHLAWLSTHAQIIGVATLAGAGAFQFSPLKKHCLLVCRHPLSFLVRHYQPGIAAAWRLGLRHGVFCLGCCWALMLIMFGVGMQSLVVMLTLTGIMVIEKTVPGGQRLSPWLGAGLLLLALGWLVLPARPL